MIKYLINKRLVIIFSIVISFSCNQVSNPKTPVVDSASSGINLPQKNISGKINASNYDEHLLDGIWTDDTSQAASFFISNDTICYTDQIEKKYVCKIITDTFVVNLDGYLDKSIIKLLNDSVFDLEDIDNKSFLHFIKIRMKS